MFDYIILGIIQGIFEWLPISSEGVVAIAGRFLVKGIDPLETALFLHSGTVLAVLLYFRKDWLEILTLKNKVLFRFLAISTVISGIIGLVLYNSLIKNMAAGGVLLLITGFGLLFTAYFHKAKRTASIGSNKLPVVTGILQGLAVIPGFSRSGATIFGLSLGKLGPAEILKISYLMSAPVVLMMSLYLFWQNPVLILETWPALIFSFLIGFLTLDFLLRVAGRIDFFRFILLFAFLCFLGAGLEFLI
jgi:undecaprenyl-diphosphatase